MKKASRVQRAGAGRLLVVLAIAVVVGVAPAAAQSGEPVGYRETIDQAVSEFAMRNFEESRSLFARAHALSPSARTLRGLGMAEFELRNYGAAIRLLEQALVSDVRPLEGGLRKETEALLARANDFIARYTIEARPPATRLAIDGVTVELPADKTLILQVGDHVLELYATGYEPELRRLSVNGGEVAKLSVVFSKSIEAAPQPAAQRERTWRRSPWLWSALGVLVAGAATATALSLTRRGGDRPEPFSGNSSVVLMPP